MKEQRKRIRREDDKIKLRWGDKEVGVPIKGILALCLFLIVAGFVVILLYSDWKIGPISHDADDVPKPKAKTVIQ